jgi:uncharacterized integral membrane protein (TIGR02327 family)
MIKVYLYTIVLFLSIWALDALDFNRFLKKNKVVQARILYLLISIMITYLIVNFIWDFYSITKI